jgi:NADH dehydrogenase (ubiquinone) 1 beta subcomplex subunit 3
MDPVKKTVAARRDPWARFEAWRYHPSINKHGNIRRMFPGLGWGIGAFIVACALEKVFEKPDEGHH